MSICKILFVLTISICYLCIGTSQSLPVGDWTGTLTPMNHPEMKLPMKYVITQSNDNYSLTLSSESGGSAEARDIVITENIIQFVFNETDANVELSCHLIKNTLEHYEGKCKDKMGKWGLFTMIPPSD